MPADWKERGEAYYRPCSRAGNVVEFLRNLNHLASHLDRQGKPNGRSCLGTQLSFREARAQIWRYRQRNCNGTRTVVRCQYFSTYGGLLLPHQMERRRETGFIPPCQNGHEALFHSTGSSLLSLNLLCDTEPKFAESVERGICVIYRPETDATTSILTSLMLWFYIDEDSGTVLGTPYCRDA